MPQGGCAKQWLRVEEGWARPKRKMASENGDGTGSKLHAGQPGNVPSLLPGARVRTRSRRVRAARVLRRHARQQLLPLDGGALPGDVQGHAALLQGAVARRAILGGCMANHRQQLLHILALVGGGPGVAEPRQGIANLRV